MMSKSSSKDEDDTLGVILDRGKHTLSKKAHVETSISKSELEVQPDAERGGHAKMCSTIVDLRLANAESERMRTRFAFETEQMRKEKDLLKTCQQEGVPCFSSWLSAYVVLLKTEFLYVGLLFCKINQYCLNFCI